MPDEEGRPDPEESRRRTVERVRGGRSPESPAEESAPTAQTIRDRVREADPEEEGRSEGAAAAAARREIRKLRRENRRLREEVAILKKAEAWFAREAAKDESER